MDNNKAQIEKLGATQAGGEVLVVHEKKENRFLSRKFLLAIVCIGTLSGTAQLVADPVVFAALCTAVTGIFGAFAGFSVKEKLQGIL